jgi:2-dehydropantoate 2-reductase
VNKRNIAVIGLGGVGGYFGFKIAQTNVLDQQNHIAFIARGQTYKAVSENGLKLLSPEHPDSVTRPDDTYQNISEIKNPDLILICVKEYDLGNVCDQLEEVITKTTILLPLMNGVDIYERIRAQLPHNIILPSCVYVASHIKEKGIIEHKGNAGRLIFGRDPNHFSSDITWVVNLMRKSKINYELRDSSLADIWTKFIFIASFGLVTAKYNSSIGTVCVDKVQKEEATEIMKEIKLIASKKDISLSHYIIEETFHKASAFPPKTPTSIQLDINSGKGHSELELFAGAIIKYGAELAIDCPRTQKIYDELRAVQVTFCK